MKICTLADCFSVVSKSGTQIDALNSLLVEKTINAINEIDHTNCLDEVESDYINDESGWVCLGLIRSIPLREKGKRKPQHFINYQISLAGDYIGHPENPNPLVYVSLWEFGASFKDDMYMTPSPSGDCEIIGNKIVQWKSQSENSWLPDLWTFAVLLEKINSIENMNENIIQPLIKLLNGKSIDEALPDTLALFKDWRRGEISG